MAEENSSIVSHLSVAMTTTTTDDAQTSGRNATTSSSSRGAGFYFQCAVVVIGVVGTAANGLVLYAMVASKQHRKQVLIFNLNVFDLCSCLLLVITFSLKLCNVHLTGRLGYWLCMLLLSDWQCQPRPRPRHFRERCTGNTTDRNNNMDIFTFTELKNAK